MRRMLGRISLLMVVLLLAGCFRQANEVLEPTPTLEQISLDTVPVEDATDEAMATEADIETTQEADMEMMTEEAAALSGEMETEEADETGLGNNNLPPITVIVPTRQAPATATDAAAQSATRFITPGVPPGPLSSAVAPTSTPSGGAPTATPSGLITPTAFISETDDDCVHVVQPNENLFRIALNNGTTVEEMRLVNPDLVGSDPILQVGQELVIPNCTPGQPAQTGADTVSAPAATPLPSVGGGETYTVQSGDTLFLIAQRYGVTVDAIVQANDLSNPDALQVGQQIVIPPSS